MPRNVVRRLSASSSTVAVMVAVLSAGPPAHLAALSAQQPDSATTSRDSLEERLRRAEEAIELLRRQLATQAASEVRTRSRVQFELFGRVLVNTFYNSGRGN